MTMDSQTFCGRFLPHQRRLFAVAVRLLRNTTEAEDAVQDVYAKLWQLRDTLPGRTQTETTGQSDGNGTALRTNGDEALLVTMIRNLCIDRLRARHDADDGERLEEEPDESAADRIESRDRLDYTMRLVDRLPPDQQRVLRLRVIDEMEYSQIETATGLSAGNVRVLLSRARRRLRELAAQQDLR